MESLKGSLSDMAELFHARMAKFEKELQKVPSATSTSSISDVETEYVRFKTFVLDALGCLQRQMEALARDVDTLEMHGRKKILLIHGVREENKEVTAQVVVKVVRDYLGLSGFATSAIKRCHRMGRQTGSSKPRPILVKLLEVGVCDGIWHAKTKFKGSGITVSEFLTRSRHQVFLAARDKFGVSKCWTKQGHIFILGPNGTRYKVSSLSELSKIPVQDVRSQEPEIPAAQVEPKKRRAVTTKK